MKKTLFLFIGFLLVFSSGINAQETDIAKYKAMFTLNFIRYIGWPEAAKQGEFVIGVLKDTQISSKLKEQSAGKKFGSQDVVIKDFKSVEELQKCQVVYVSRSINLSKNIAAITQKMGGKNFLIISEVDGATELGSMINFVISDDRLKFEISKANADKVGLQISSKLETMSNAIVK